MIGFYETHHDTSDFYTCECCGSPNHHGCKQARVIGMHTGKNMGFTKQNFDGDMIVYVIE